MRASELPASPSRSVLTIGIAPPTDQADHRGANRAQTGNTDFQGRRHGEVASELESAPFGQGKDVVQLFRRAFKKAANVARGLPNALLILHQSNTHVSFAVFPE